MALRIKDNVDLKKLEKFGFKKDKELSDKFSDTYSVSTGYQRLCFENSECRLLYLFEGSFNSNTMILNCDVLYDLIKADLVEKVVE